MEAPKRCPRCGAPLRGGEAGGCCTPCALRAALAEEDSADAGEEDFALLDGADGAGPVAVEGAGSFSHYDLLAPLGRGGMGMVWRARDRVTRREVALKLIAMERAGDPLAVARFRHEVIAAARLEHPAVLPVYEVGEERGVPFFTMRLASGGTLADRLPGWRESAEASARLMARIARGVAHAHARGVIHRDLKPANILLGAEGEPFVADFGIALLDGRPGGLTHTGALMGSPQYLAPEQARGAGRVTAASDVFALGAMLFELLCGRAAFRGATLYETLQAVAEEEVPAPHRVAPGVPRTLGLVCLRCLQKDPARRYPDAGALAEELEQALAGATLSPTTRRVAGPRRRRAWRRGLIAGAATLAALGIGTLAWTRWLVPHDGVAGSSRLAELRAETRSAEAALLVFQANERLVRADTRPALELAEDLGRRALRLDSGFASALAVVSLADTRLFWRKHDPRPERRDTARAAAERAVALAPGRPAGYEALGVYLFHCEHRPAEALAQFAAARARAAGRKVADLEMQMGGVERFQGRWDAAEGHFLSAARLDPENPAVHLMAARLYEVTRRYDDALAALDRSLACSGAEPGTVVERAVVRLRADGDANAFLQSVDDLTRQGGVGADVESRFVGLFWSGRLAEALALIDAQGTDFAFRDVTTFEPKEMIRARILRAQGKVEEARRAWSAAREALAAELAAAPEEPRLHAALGRVLAALGEREAALAAARRAVALCPPENDAVAAPLYADALAETLLWCGETERAEELIRRQLAAPGYLTRGEILESPDWQPVRAHFAVR